MQLFISHFKTEVSWEGVQYHFCRDKKKVEIRAKINEWDEWDMVESKALMINLFDTIVDNSNESLI